MIRNVGRMTFQCKLFESNDVSLSSLTDMKLGVGGKASYILILQGLQAY